jgi:hypothetical protein
MAGSYHGVLVRRLMLEGKQAEQEVSNNLLATKTAAYEKTSDGLEKKLDGLKKKHDVVVK